MFAKKILMIFSIIAFLAFSNSKVWAADYSANTSDALISKAISLTVNINNGSVVKVLNGYNSTKKPVYVQFANLSAISIDYMNDDAVTLIDSNGNMKIFINKSLRNSPPEAIACLLEHETTHNDAVSSIDEEVAAWTKEATSWVYFTKKNPSLAKLDESQYPLVDRLNCIVELYKKSGYTSIAIRQEVLSLGNYSTLAMHSDGY